MYTVYKISNKITKDCYIGVTGASLEERMRTHIKDSKTERCKDRPLYVAMNEYGIEAFEIEPLEVVSKEDRFERERYWIQKYRSYDYGYNLTHGGGGKPFVDDSLLSAFWLRGMNVSEISNRTSWSPDAIRSHLHQLNIPTNEIKQRAYGCQGKAVIQLDKEDNPIASFPSLSSAGLSLGLKATTGGENHIAQVCNGERKTAYGYKWRWG